jgi:hypothetical protein
MIIHTHSLTKRVTESAPCVIRYFHKITYCEVMRLIIYYGGVMSVYCDPCSVIHHFIYETAVRQWNISRQITYEYALVYKVRKLR